MFISGHCVCVYTDAGCLGMGGAEGLPVWHLMKKAYEEEKIEKKKKVAEEIFEMVFGELPNTIDIEQGKVVAEKTMKLEEFAKKYGDEMLKMLVEIIKHNEGDVVLGTITLFVEVNYIPMDVVSVIDVVDVAYDRDCDVDGDVYDCVAYITTGGDGVEWGIKLRFSAN